MYSKGVCSAGGPVFVFDACLGSAAFKTIACGRLPDGKEHAGVDKVEGVNGKNDHATVEDV